MKKQDKLLRFYCDESDPILKAIKHNNFNIARNSVISDKKAFKKQYYNTLFKNIPQTLKKLGMELNQLL